MRLDGAVPEGPGLARGRGGEEVREVRGVIGVADAAGGRRGLAGVEGRAGHLPRPAGGVARHPGAPALGGVADEPAVLRQRLAPALEFRREEAEVVRRLLQLPRIAARSKLVHQHEATVWLSTTNFYALKKCSVTLPAFADTVPLHP